MKAAIRLACLFTLITTVASAQMMGGGNPRRGTPGVPGSSLGSPFSSMGAAMGGVTVGPDGTAYVLQLTDAGGDGSWEAELIAVATTTTVRWRTAVDPGMSILSISENAVYLATAAIASGRGWMHTEPGSLSSTLVALNASTGAVAWSVEIEGIVMGLEPFPGGVWVLAVEVSSTSWTTMPPARGVHGMMGERSLIAISNSGDVIGEVPLAP